MKYLLGIGLFTRDYSVKRMVFSSAAECCDIQPLHFVCLCIQTNQFLLFAIASGQSIGRDGSFSHVDFIILSLLTDYVECFQDFLKETHNGSWELLYMLKLIRGSNYIEASSQSISSYNQWFSSLSGHWPTIIKVVSKAIP